MDWHSRAVPGWRVSGTPGTGFCLEAPAMAVRVVAGCVPGIINTGQGCQFTSAEWVGAVEGPGARVGMDGRGRWLDNVFIGRPWRSPKHGGVLLSEQRDVRGMTLAVDGWLERYDRGRLHRSRRYATPREVYRPAAACAACPPPGCPQPAAPSGGLRAHSRVPPAVDKPHPGIPTA